MEEEWPIDESWAGSPARKDDVIADLIASGILPHGRETLYRAWCRAVGVAVLASDLERLRKGRRRELQRPLLED
jgi:hypothetical protein